MRPTSLRPLVSGLLFRVVVISALAVQLFSLQGQELPKPAKITAPAFNPYLPVITISADDRLLLEVMLTTVLQTQRFNVIEPGFLGNTLAEIHSGRRNHGIGAKYLLDCSSTPLLNQKRATIKAKIILTETGAVLTEKQVAGRVDSFSARDSLTMKLIQALVSDPKFIASLSPAEKESWRRNLV